MTHIVVVDDDTPGRTTERRVVAGFDCMMQQRFSMVDPTRLLTTHVVRSGIITIVCVTRSNHTSGANSAARAAWVECEETATAVRAVVAAELRKAGQWAPGVTA